MKPCLQPEFVNPCFGLAPGPHLALTELELRWSLELGFAPGSVLQYQNLTVLGFAPASVLQYQNLTVLGSVSASVLNLGLFGVEIGIG